MFQYASHSRFTLLGNSRKRARSIPFDCARVLRAAVALDLGVTGKGQSQAVSQPSGPSSTLLAAGKCATQVAHISGSMMNHLNFPRNPASTTSACDCECKAKFKVADVASVQLTIELRHHWTGLRCVYEQQSKSKSESPSPSQSEPALSCT